MNNLTPTEYDRFAWQYGLVTARDRYPFSLCYRYAAQLDEHPDHVMFYANEQDRESHARTLRSLGGKITGASGGDVSRVTQTRRSP